jgi:putative transposase
MYFIEGDLYHIYNRGNNSQQIFFNRNNYLFFLNKIKEFILPHAEILAWCLMPNHFHLMIEVLSENIPINSQGDYSPGDFKSPGEYKLRTLNDSIAIMLRSYTRAINKQESRTGALFQQGTKSTWLNEHELSQAYFQTAYGTIGNISIPEIEYPCVCFNYIHQNPVKNGLVKTPGEWEFSSYRDYYCARDESFVKRESAVKLGLYSPNE